MKSSLLALSVLLTLSSHTLAQTTSNFFGSLALGASRANLSVGEINTGFRSDGLFNPSTTISNSDTAYRIGGGYRVSPNVAFELYYADLGKYGSQSIASLTPTSGTVAIDAAYKSSGVGVDLVLSAPALEFLTVYGRIGALRAKTAGDFSLTGSPSFRVTDATAKTTGNAVGVGLRYDLNKQLGLTAEAQRYAKLGNDSTGGELRVTVYSLGARFNF